MHRIYLLQTKDTHCVSGFSSSLVYVLKRMDKKTNQKNVLKRMDKKANQNSVETDG